MNRHSTIVDGESKRPGWVARYSLAFVMVALAVSARRWLESKVGPMPTFITFYPSVLIVANLAGGGPGVLAT